MSYYNVLKIKSILFITFYATRPTTLYVLRPFTWRIFPMKIYMNTFLFEIKISIGIHQQNLKLLYWLTQFWSMEKWVCPKTYIGANYLYNNFHIWSKLSLMWTTLCSIPHLFSRNHNSLPNHRFLTYKQ